MLLLAPLWGLLLPASVVVGGFALGADDGAVALVALAGFAVVGGTWWGFRVWMRRHGAVERSWELPLVVLTSAGVGAVVGALRLWWGVAVAPDPVALAGWCLVVALVGAAAVWVMRPGVLRVVVSVGVVLVLSAAALGVSWGQRRAEEMRENDALAREVAGLAVVVGVLEAPGWEPVSMEVRGGRSPVEISYEPRGVGEKGLTLEVRTIVREEEGPGESGLPRWVECAGEEAGGEWCARHGAVTVYDNTGGAFRSLQAWVEVEEGVVVLLSPRVPRLKDGTPTMEMPELDMVELAGSVRGVGGEQAQEVVARVR
ncbi:hypothetical protein [Nocardiopsis sp. NPDC006938]|uniref:hypothetical protein n=1 Tax=Nocardiopsis sp. NPDC006938 TaxID=3364337 RepID=UPI00367B53FB